MSYTQPPSTLIRMRYSCRTYEAVPIAAAKRQALAEFAATRQQGPLGTPARFALITTTEQDHSALRGLGTYGFIRGATGFILGAVQRGPHDMPDFGCLLEQIVLYATDLGLGTCWLGGTYTRSTFARQIALDKGEVMPAVIALGIIARQRSQVDRGIRRAAQGDRRLPGERLFFDGDFSHPLGEETAGAYAVPLQMVRLGPSASNKQPWRIVRDGSAWHFYVQRTPGYTRGLARPFVHGDLQRVDMGIAMCHWELSAAERGLLGSWTVAEPAVVRPDEHTEYVVSWVAAPDA